MASGRRCYVCDECKAKSYFHWTATLRAARIRCTSCGSARLELKSEAAKEERARVGGARALGRQFS
jgi:DNA-directed RNA polymerase subunit RPC12/RpoP